MNGDQYLIVLLCIFLADFFCWRRDTHPWRLRYWIRVWLYMHWKSDLHGYVVWNSTWTTWHAQRVQTLPCECCRMYILAWRLRCMNDARRSANNKSLCTCMRHGESNAFFSIQTWMMICMHLDWAPCTSDSVHGFSRLSKAVMEYITWLTTWLLFEWAAGKGSVPVQFMYAQRFANVQSLCAGIWLQRKHSKCCFMWIFKPRCRSRHAWRQL